MPTVKLDGKTVTYTVKYSQRARRMRLEMGWETGLSVIVPRCYRFNDFARVLEDKKKWVLDKVAQFSSRPRPARVAGTIPDSVPYLGRRLGVVTRNGVDTPTVIFEDDSLVLCLKDPGSADLVLRKWYLKQAASVIGKRVDELSEVLGVTYKRLSIRGQKTRWASCSAQGCLSFNWKLMMMPEPVIDYIIIHELAHLRVMNHGKRFWGFVAKHCAGWRDHRVWLKEHEAEIATHFYF